MFRYFLALSLCLCSCSIDALYGQQRTIGLFKNDTKSVNGYTLWTVGRGTYLIDNCGYLVHNWEHEVDPGLSVYLLENGNLLRTGRLATGNFSAGGTGGLIEEYDWAGDLLWSYELSSSERKQHHDIEPLPNGNVLVINWELKTVAEAEAAGATNSREYWPEAIFELEKVGTDRAKVVWEWHIWDHLVQDEDPDLPNYGVVSEHPELMNINYNPPRVGGQGGGDWLHFNGIDYDPQRDEILVSSRIMNEIWIIDHSTTTEEAAGHSGGIRGRGGDLLYRWGNPEAYGKSGRQTLFGQHDVRIIHEDYPYAGSISVFNNGANRPEGSFSTVDLLSPPRDIDGNYVLGANGTYGPEDLTWQYVADPPTNFYSNNRAGAHLLPNGNVLICEDNAARFFEVTDTGEIVWDYRNTIGRNGPLTQGSTANRTSIFRVTRYLPDYPAFAGRDLTPGDPVELDPSDYDCEIYPSSIKENEQAELSDVSISNLGDVLVITNLLSQEKEVSVFSMDVRLMERFNCGQGSSELDLTFYPSGIYIVHIHSPDHRESVAYKFIKF